MGDGSIAKVEGLGLKSVDSHEFRMKQRSIFNSRSTPSSVQNPKLGVSGSSMAATRKVSDLSPDIRDAPVNASSLQQSPNPSFVQSNVYPLRSKSGSKNSNLAAKYSQIHNTSGTPSLFDHNPNLPANPNPKKGTRIEVTPDVLAKFGKVNRPLPDEPQYPYKKGEKKPGWKKICKKMLQRGCEPNERGILYLRDLENVHPKPPHRNVSKNQAHLLYAIYKGRKPDIALLWFRSIYAVYCNDSEVASLPLAVLLTNFMLNEHGIPVDSLDDWDWPKKPLGCGTMGKSEGQSKNHRVSKFPNLATVQGNNDLLVALHENISDALDLLMDMEKRQVRIDNGQKQIIRRVKRIEDKLGICEDDDDEDEDDNETDGDDDDEDESEAHANHEEDDQSESGGDDEDHGE